MSVAEPNRKKTDCSASALAEEKRQKLQNTRGKVVWSIAGFDPSSGAGVTADLMTFAAHGFFGCSAITATTVQNTLGVFATSPADPGELLDTLNRLREDLPPAGIKIGMLGTAAIAEAIADWLQGRRFVRDWNPVIVLDPVLRSSSGTVLYPDDGLRLLHSDLLPQVDWITPNWSELAVLAQKPVTSTIEASEAAQKLSRSLPHLSVVATGGDQVTPADLLLESNGSESLIQGRRIATTSTHGTGCAFSSALLCQIVAGATPTKAVQRAKAFVEGALEAAPGLGRGRGPMDLLWPLRPPKGPAQDCYSEDLEQPRDSYH